MGDEEVEASGSAPPIHASLVPIWSAILGNGLKDESRDNLITRYAIPVNCPRMAPPKLNKEVKAAVNEAAVNRDVRFGTVQAMLGASLSALGQSLTSILTDTFNEDTKHSLLSSVGDAARLIAAVHHQQTQARKLILKSQLNKNVADTLSDSPSDDGWLFGTNLSERIQAAKALDKTTAELRKAKVPVKAASSGYKQKTQPSRGNFRGPSRPQQRPLRQDGPYNAVTKKYLPSKQKPQSYRKVDDRRRH